MSLETAADARRVAQLSKAEYERLLSYLEALPAKGWAEGSACADWKVYQCVSHIGSQPRIHQGALEAALRGAPPMDDAGRRAVWDRFDSLKPLEVLAAFKETNSAFIGLIDSLSESELAARIPWFSGPTTVAGVLAGRLNEQVLHAWDVRASRDDSARLTAATLPDLLELNLTPSRLGTLVKPEHAPSLSGRTVQFHLTDPDGRAYLKLDPGAVQGGAGSVAAPDLTLLLPTEAFIRLLWGRYTNADPVLPDGLRALFPGR